MTAFIVVTFVFFSLHLVPGDPVMLLLSGGGTSTPPQEAIDLVRRQLGLDQPVLVQYMNYLKGLAVGNLGASFQDGVPVAELIADRLPRTLELILAATVLAVIFALPLGLISARRRGTPTDSSLIAASSIIMSTPTFVKGTLFIFVFGQVLGWASIGGYADFTVSPLKHLGYLIMPAASIALGLMAITFRMVRSSILEVLEKDWVRTARSKGLKERIVMARHVVRNSLTPVLTLVGMQMGSLLGGTVVIEYVFNWPGLSNALVQAVERRDYPEVQGIVIVISLLFVLINLAVDLLYGALDPRARRA